MAKLSDTEVVGLIDSALDRCLGGGSFDTNSMRQSISEAVLQAFEKAGAIVIREQRRHRGDGSYMAVVRSGALAFP